MTLTDNDVVDEINRIARIPCGNCGHSFAIHTKKSRTGFWKCQRRDCTCQMFMDGDWPVPVKEG